MFLVKQTFFRFHVSSHKLFIFISKSKQAMKHKTNNLNLKSAIKLINLRVHSKTSSAQKPLRFLECFISRPHMWWGRTSGQNPRIFFFFFFPVCIIHLLFGISVRNSRNLLQPLNLFPFFFGNRAFLLLCC